MVAHPSDPEWETCRACLAPVLAELAASQAMDGNGGIEDSRETLAVKEKWQALFWRARTWSSRRKHLSLCEKQSPETRGMAQSLLDANANSNRKAAAQREDKRRKPDGTQLQDPAAQLGDAPGSAVAPAAARRSRVKSAVHAANKDLAVPSASMPLSSSVSSASSSTGSFFDHR